jgi:hypothetical protein
MSALFLSAAVSMRPTTVVKAVWSRSTATTTKALGSVMPQGENKKNALCATMGDKNKKPAAKPPAKPPAGKPIVKPIAPKKPPAKKP